MPEIKKNNLFLLETFQKWHILNNLFFNFKYDYIILILYSINYQNFKNFNLKTIFDKVAFFSRLNISLDEKISSLLKTHNNELLFDLKSKMFARTQ